MLSWYDVSTEAQNDLFEIWTRIASRPYLPDVSVSRDLPIGREAYPHYGRTSWPA
jgi:hypothetical protein